jgi:hypothetical protein
MVVKKLFSKATPVVIASAEKKYCSHHSSRIMVSFSHAASALGKGGHCIFAGRRIAVAWAFNLHPAQRPAARVRERLQSGRSLPNTCKNDFNRLILLLWPKGSLIIGVQNEGAPRIDSKRIEDALVVLARDEDALVVLARDYTGLATFSVDETNGGAEPRRSSRARCPFQSRPSLIALSTCYRVLPARRKRQQQENDKAARLHDGLSNYQGCRIK